jgi:hypothetical protein
MQKSFYREERTPALPKDTGTGVAGGAREEREGNSKTF